MSNISAEIPSNSVSDYTGVVPTEAAVVVRRCVAGFMPFVALLITAASIGQQQELSLQQPETIGQEQRDGGQDDTLSALRQGQLNVWLVRPPSHFPLTSLQIIARLNNATPLTYQEKTLSEFGQTGKFGMDASDYGVDADSRSISVPQPAQGQDASSATPNGIGYREEEASDFGQGWSAFGPVSTNYYGDPGVLDGASSSRKPESNSEENTETNSNAVDPIGNPPGTLANAANNAPNPQTDPITCNLSSKRIALYGE